MDSRLHFILYPKFTAWGLLLTVVWLPSLCAGGFQGPEPLRYGCIKNDLCSIHELPREKSACPIIRFLKACERPPTHYKEEHDLER